MSAAKSLSLLKSIEFLIRIQKGPDAGKTFRIFPPMIEIGRDKNLQIVVTDPKASRKQCAVIINDDVILRDESSRQTTLINGQHAKEHKLKPGDIISFGDTEIQFIAKSVTPQKTKTSALPGNQKPVTADKQQARKRFYMFAGVIALLGALLFLLEDPVPVVEEKLITKEQLKKQIEESEQRQVDIKENRKGEKNTAEKKYLFSVEQHFIKGFRDLQTGQYGRALESFGTTIASDNSHHRAQQYTKIAKKKRMDLIDTHMRDGIKYKEKVMYKRCIAEFEKAIVLINNKKSQKYKISKAQREECRLLQSGRF